MVRGHGGLRRGVTLRAAEGRAAKERYEASGAEYDPEFTPADRAALSGAWGSWLADIVGPAVEAGRTG